MARKKKEAKRDILEELDELLFAGEGNTETEGLLTYTKRMLSGDRQQAKIARVAEIVKEL